MLRLAGFRQISLDLLLLIFIALTFSTPETYAQGDVLRALSYGGESIDAVKDLATDEAGNVYLTGRYSGEIDFDPGPGTALLPNLPNVSEYFTVKFGVDGAFLWARANAGRSKFAVLNSEHIAVDSEGSVYRTGFFEDTVDFDPGPGVFNLSANADNIEVYLQKLDTDGNFVWARRLGEAGDPIGLEVDKAGILYWIGNRGGTSTGNLLLNKFDADNNFLGSLNIVATVDTTSASAFVIPTSVALDQLGNLYIVGEFSGTVDFSPNDGGTSNDTLIGGAFGEAFIWKLSVGEDSNESWVRSVVGPNEGVFARVAIDSLGNVLVTGVFRTNNGAFDFDPGPDTFSLAGSGDINEPDKFLVKLDSDGNFAFASLLFGKINSQAGDGNVQSLATDSAGNLYLSGSFFRTIDLDVSAESRLLSSIGSLDGFTAKYDQSFRLVWSRQYSGITDQATTCGSIIAPVATAVDRFGNVHVGGDFTLTVNVGQSTLFETLRPGSIPCSTRGDAFFVTLSDGLPECAKFGNKIGTLSWVNATGGAFNTASNWSPARSPLPSDDLLLDLDQNYTILLDGTETANSLLIQGGFPVLEGRGKLNLESLGEGSCGPSFSVEEGGRLLLTNGAAGDGDVTVSARTVLVGAAEGAAQSSLVLFGSTLEAPTSISVARNGSIHSGDAGLDAPPGLLLTPRVIVGQGTPLPADGFLLPSLELDGGAYDWDIAEVGEESPGLLSLSGGGILNLETLKLGQTPNQRGDVELSDPTTQLISDNAGVGDTGPGRLRISNGASFTSSFLFLGIEESGEVLVEGRSAVNSPSSLTLSQARFGVEENGLASLQVSQGGQASVTGEARFGIKGAAFLNVADPDSTLDIAGTTTLGEGGNGNLAINTGAKVTLLGALTLGAQASGVGDLKIEGAFNSELPAELSGEAITVGVAGEGTFEVRNGARARLSGDLEVASLPEGRGTVVLDGEPRTPIGAPVDDTITLASEGTLILGAAGRATMNMLNGATAEFAAMRVGGGVQATRFTMESSSMTVATTSSSDELLGQVFIGGGEGRSVLELRRQSSLFVLSSPALLAAGDMFVQRNGLLRIDPSSVVSVREITVFGTLVGQVIEASTTPKQGETSGGIQGNVVISPEGTLALEFTPGQAGPALSITGNLTQGGTLEVRFLEDFEPFAGQILPLVDLSGESSGSFTAFRFPTRSNDFEGNVSASSTGSLELTVVNPGTAVPFDDGEGEQPIEGEGAKEGSLEGEIDGEAQAEGEGETLPQPVPGCNGCQDGKSLLHPSAAGEWLIGIFSFALLLASRRRYFC